MKFVDLDRVSLRYGEDADGTLALHRATLHVGDGEFVAVVGPSGCGKSTLMKVVTGLWPPTAGAVIVSGREVTAPLSIAGMAFQNPTLLPWRTALANVMLPLEIVEPHCSRLKRERAAYLAKARDLLALVGLLGTLAATTLALMELAATAGVTVGSLSVQSTTLDDVFVHYTGRALRDALQEANPLDRGPLLRRA